MHNKLPLIDIESELYNEIPLNSETRRKYVYLKERNMTYHPTKSDKHECARKVSTSAVSSA